jgi:N-acetyl-anhydromuramyl-L-alanine amidase AmpD
MTTQQLHDELLEGYLLETREQIQQDLLTYIYSDNQGLNDKMCQIVVDNFDKLFSKVK